MSSKVSKVEVVGEKNKKARAFCRRIASKKEVDNAQFSESQDLEIPANKPLILGRTNVKQSDSSDDKRLSRKQAELSFDPDTLQVTLTRRGVNAMKIFGSEPNDHIIQRNVPYSLSNGDRFSLLLDDYVFTISIVRDGIGDSISKSQTKNGKKPICKEGSNCRLREAAHLEEFDHPSEDLPQDKESSSTKRSVATLSFNSLDDMRKTSLSSLEAPSKELSSKKRSSGHRDPHDEKRQKEAAKVTKKRSDSVGEESEAKRGGAKKLRVQEGAADGDASKTDVASSSTTATNAHSKKRKEVSEDADLSKNFSFSLDGNGKDSATTSAPAGDSAGSKAKLQKLKLSNSLELLDTDDKGRPRPPSPSELNIPLKKARMRSDESRHATLALPIFSTSRKHGFPARRGVLILLNALGKFLRKNNDNSHLKIVIIERAESSALKELRNLRSEAERSELHFSQGSDRLDTGAVQLALTDARVKIVAMSTENNISKMKTNFQHGSCRVLANEATWRLKAGANGGSTNKYIFDAAGADFEQLSVKVHPAREVGGVYPVELPSTSPLARSQDVDYVIHVVSPSIAASSPDAMTEEDAADVLQKCYTVLLEKFTSLTMT